MRDEAENCVRFMITDSRHKEIQSYVERGRTFQNESEEYLVEEFVLEMKKWASTPPPWELPVRMNDIESECNLREIDLPWERVEQYWNTIVEKVRALMEKRPPGGSDGNGYLDGKIEEYYRAQAKKN